MKNGVDFVYDYSDLNWYHIRVQLLTGPYAGLIFELGGSGVGQDGVESKFVFEYILYEKPEAYKDIVLRGNPEFEEYLSGVIFDVIIARQSDPDDRKRLARSFDPTQHCEVAIDKKFYGGAACR